MRIRYWSSDVCSSDLTDWRGNNNIAESIVGQLQHERYPEPAWIVCGAGTGGTSATIGRYLRYRGLRTRLCVAEPTGMAFARAWHTRDHGARATHSTCLEGIGRPTAEPGFLFEVVDEVIEVPDAASTAGAQLLEHYLGRRYGGSSGTNLVACLKLAEDMHRRGEPGSIVSLLCDRGERYDRTLYEPRSEEHTSELQSLMRISYAVFCLKKKKNTTNYIHNKNDYYTIL